jgi:hypothetical protein
MLHCKNLKNEDFKQQKVVKCYQPNPPPHIYLIYNGNLNIYRFADPYLKPVESTLVRHVQSSQDHTKLDEGIF